MWYVFKLLVLDQIRNLKTPNNLECILYKSYRATSLSFILFDLKSNMLLDSQKKKKKKKKKKKRERKK